MGMKGVITARIMGRKHLCFVCPRLVFRDKIERKKSTFFTAVAVIPQSEWSNGSQIILMIFIAFTLFLNIKI